MTRGRAHLVVLLSLWAGSVAAGFGWIVHYDSLPGAAGSPPVLWPERTRIRPAPGTPTLVMAAHPRCPCTRASIAELARIMARCTGRLEARVLLFSPRGVGRDWANTGLRDRAAGIPGVTVERDEDGLEAKRFGLATSGHTLLYDERGLLRFSGGLTASRGHEGDNEGVAAIVALVNGRPAARARTAAFGCGIFGPRTHGSGE